MNLDLGLVAKQLLKMANLVHLYKELDKNMAHFFSILFILEAHR
jgi:hypothetical protein